MEENKQIEVPKKIYEESTHSEKLLKIASVYKKITIILCIVSFVCSVFVFGEMFNFEETPYFIGCMLSVSLAIFFNIIFAFGLYEFIFVFIEIAQKIKEK